MEQMESVEYFEAWEIDILDFCIYQIVRFLSSYRLNWS